ncbi:hypothetical protein DFH11DRAFT_1109404 [Phellopilus nigrolimitatus]|nr:hypothetical protein DFH11DRAFT_1109404 [Phellopilus nigrolimitatus]
MPLFSQRRRGPSDLAISRTMQSKVPSRTVDLLFIQDTSEKQDDFLLNSVKTIEDICRHVFHLPQHPGNLRVGLIAYHDEPKNDGSPLTENFPFTSEMELMIQNLHSLQGSQNATDSRGSNDALEFALDAAQRLDWRPSADKIAVLFVHRESRRLDDNGLLVLQLFANQNIFLKVRRYEHRQSSKIESSPIA